MVSDARRSYVGGRWVEGRANSQTLVNPATEEPLARAGAGGLDLAGRARLRAHARAARRCAR